MSRLNYKTKSRPTPIQFSQIRSTRAREIEVFANRTVAMEDGFCRYLASYGLALPYQLAMMEPAGRIQKVLEDFAHFSHHEIPVSCFPPINQTRLWPWSTGPWPEERAGSRWGDSKSRSRRTYTAWYWDIMRIGCLGSNSSENAQNKPFRFG